MSRRRPCANSIARAPWKSRAALEQRAPAHPAVTSVDEYTPDRHVLCGDTPCVVSGYKGIFVFTFEDSTAVPIVVSCPGIAGCRAIENYGMG